MKLDLGRVKGDKGDTGAKGATGAKGTDGREVEITRDDAYLKWRYVGESNWKYLIAVADLKGDTGAVTGESLNQYNEVYFANAQGSLRAYRVDDSTFTCLDAARDGTICRLQVINFADGGYDVNLYRSPDGATWNYVGTVTHTGNLQSCIDRMGDIYFNQHFGRLYAWNDGVTTYTYLDAVSHAGVCRLQLDNYADGATKLHLYRTPDNVNWTHVGEVLHTGNTDLAFAQNSGAHNSIFRGKHLGTAVTDAQYAAIAAGTFADLYIGDFWIINDIVWRIAAFDYYYDTAPRPSHCTTHHVLLIPDATLYRTTMNDTNVVTGGYIGSKMRQTNLAQAKTIVSNAFGNHVLTYRNYFSNAVTSGQETGFAWVDADVELLNEMMVYGANIWHTPVGTLDYGQLPLFQYWHGRTVTNSGWWLRDVNRIGDGFAAVEYHGLVGTYTPSSTLGVRPYFCIC